MKLKIGYQELIARAMAEIETVSVEQAEHFLGDENTVFVDIRDVSAGEMLYSVSGRNWSSDSEVQKCFRSVQVPDPDPCRNILPCCSACHVL